MARDPFANYDAWKTTDTAYEEACARSDWEEAHTHYTMACCGAELAVAELDFNTDGTPCSRRCPVCVDEDDPTVHLFEAVNVEIEEPPTAADYADDRPDDGDICHPYYDGR